MVNNGRMGTRSRLATERKVKALSAKLACEDIKGTVERFESLPNGEEFEALLRLFFGSSVDTAQLAEDYGDCHETLQLIAKVVNQLFYELETAGEPAAE